MVILLVKDISTNDIVEIFAASHSDSTIDYVTVFDYNTESVVSIDSVYSVSSYPEDSEPKIYVLDPVTTLPVQILINKPVGEPTLTEIAV